MRWTHECRKVCEVLSPCVDLEFEVLAIFHAVKRDWCNIMTSQETHIGRGTVNFSRRLQCILSCVFDWKEIGAPR